MNNNTDLEHLVRYVAGECSDQEEKNIEAWINDHPEKKIIIQKVQKVWKSKMKWGHFFDTEAAWDRLEKEMDRDDAVRVIQTTQKIVSSQAGNTYKRRRLSSIRQIVCAAAVVILVGFAALYYYHITTDDSGQPALQEVVTERGGRVDVRLNDGSRIHLSVDSKVSYPREFGTDKRTVHLTGVAYFEVVPDDRPFFVHAYEAVVQILGTEFNVQAYEDEEIRVVVADGEVAVG